MGRLASDDAPFFLINWPYVLIHMLSFSRFGGFRFGVRSFLTGFDGEKFIDIGNRDITRIFRLGQHIDKLIRAKTGLKGRMTYYGAT